MLINKIISKIIHQKLKKISYNIRNKHLKLSLMTVYIKKECFQKYNLVILQLAKALNRLIIKIFQLTTALYRLIILILQLTIALNHLIILLEPYIIINLE